MPIKTIYSSDKASSDQMELEIHINRVKELFICLSPFGTRSNDQWIALPYQDARELILRLVSEFELEGEIVEEWKNESL